MKLFLVTHPAVIVVAAETVLRARQMAQEAIDGIDGAPKGDPVVIELPFDKEHAWPVA